MQYQTDNNTTGTSTISKPSHQARKLLPQSHSCFIKRNATSQKERCLYPLWQLSILLRIYWCTRKPVLMPDDFLLAFFGFSVRIFHTDLAQVTGATPTASSNTGFGLIISSSRRTRAEQSVQLCRHDYHRLPSCAAR